MKKQTVKTNKQWRNMNKSKTKSNKIKIKKIGTELQIKKKRMKKK